MELQGASDTIMYKAFSLTLRDKAQRWFREQRLIETWIHMATTLSAKFIGPMAKTIPN